MARSPFSAKHRTLSVSGARIANISMPFVGESQHPSDEDTVLDLSGHLLLPGLINTHDHLDFALFPQLGSGPYGNWREWAADIYRPVESPVEEQLRVSLETRLWWGGIRNLLCGATTVSHHNRYSEQTFSQDFPVDVASEYGWAHSVADPEKLVERYHQTPRDWPFILHLAEGTDQIAKREFEELESLVPIDERLVLVHGVGLTPAQLERVAHARAGVIWCPMSNCSTLGRTLSLEQISCLPNVALGTDSPLTADCDVLDQIRFVHRQMEIPSSLLYELVTSRAARLLRLKSSEGSLQNGGTANMIAVRDRSLNPAETLSELCWKDIEFVMQQGRIVLLSRGLASCIPATLREGMEEIVVDGVQRLIRAPVRRLLSEASAALGQAPRLAGRAITVPEANQFSAGPMIRMAGD